MSRPAVWRRALLVVGALTLVALGASACESTTSDRNEVIRLVNESRQRAGLKRLTENMKLDIKADAWAQHLRDICDLAHSRLADGAPGNWTKLGENVGYGGNIGQVHVAYMNSPGHKANILDPSFQTMGAAAVYGTCNGQRRVFTVQVFMRT